MNLIFRHKLFLVLHFFFISIAIFLLAVNLLGSVFPNKVNEAIALTKEHKNQLPFLNAKSAIKELESINTTEIDLEKFKKINRIFASSIVHYWPTNKNFFSPFENWIIYSLQQIELLFSSKSLFSNIERFQWRKILETGYGLCSQQALAIFDYLKERKIHSNIIGLNGHIVVGVRHGDEYYILDPDYNVVIEAELSEIHKKKKNISKVYTSAGYSSETANTIEKIYTSAEDNWIGTRFDYQKKLGIFFIISDILKWLFPLILLLVALLGLYKHKKH